MKPVIFGVSGLELTAEERDFFRDADPLGYILFKRNCGDRAQMKALTDSLRALSGRVDLPILIDQEGGRVARMQPPVWPAFPAGAAFDALYEKAPISAIEAARANGQALGLMLSEVGVTVDCAPLLDVRRPEVTDAIGDRALGGEPMRVAALGRAILDGLRRGGVVGVVKHMPGHGRALVDSHLELPRVKADAAALEVDIEPFARLADAPMGMTAHLVFEAWDQDRPATLSPIVVRDIIRGRIGFDGLLFTDDIDMKALSGTPGEKAMAALAAGCDVVLDCWARMEEMVEITGLLPDAGPECLDRLARAMATIADGPEAADIDALIAKRDALLALA
ncbi:beta-N-acetylhexosaminidase [Sphingomonas sp. JC676]|uniref:beta-N-acetylhexosaminidase n=1 Tax=Sphingomonas sp. JC676 TaxID=2768065 RepID=UPI001657D006|nr:beta-N-acetylhexosaminidase [Sphingomonas sp. JC676]MBC9032347.1 beta-N-acetylhexosaminidase [Sphingomonas sp. JC676]